jgi:hypothetical protein
MMLAGRENTCILVYMSKTIEGLPKIGKKKGSGGWAKENRESDKDQTEIRYTTRDSKSEAKLLVANFDKIRIAESANCIRARGQGY